MSVLGADPLREMFAYARDQLRLADPPKTSAFGRFLTSLKAENDRIRMDLKAAAEKLWATADATRKLHIAEDAVRRLTRDLSLALSRSAEPERSASPEPPPQATPPFAPEPRRGGLSDIARALMKRPDADTIGEAEERRMREQEAA